MLKEHQDFEELSRVLSSFGIQKGDVVYVASDITKLMYHVYNECGCDTEIDYDEYLNQLVDTLRKYIGPEGTLLFPVYTWDFCRGNPFSLKETKGEVGALNNWVLKKRKDFRRTQHPMYSFMVWGKDAQMLVNMDNRDAWGEDSPFSYLEKNNAKTLMVDLPPSRCFTFLHYVEQKLRVPWRYTKEFRSLYTDAAGSTAERIYSMFVRDLDIESEVTKTLDALLEQSGLLQKIGWADITLYYTACQEAVPILADDLQNHNAKMCYQFEGYTPDWKSGPTHKDYLIGEVKGL